MTGPDSLVRQLTYLRTSREWTLDQLAQVSGISRATLSRIERGETSPTAAVLGQLATAFGVPMAELFGAVREVAPPLIRREEQDVWSDPDSGFTRRSLSPPAPGYRATVIEGQISAGGRVAYGTSPLPDLEHHLVLLEGELEIELGGRIHRLQAGDCLRFKLHSGNSFHAPGPDKARYILTVVAP
ncbi:helix-turn-helix domain-containing protein [Roseibium suaedae]|uniref:Transcriptional regulator, XRE family with cupin sensor n=1 Tax=Roseibium suaedae TaxID=735517 RepID=A0A1M7GBZ1_9HYPH|nr:helix-turn-helix domain-containing protein [Roseibium suaedae]SHM13820.1 transcriptional regulator, XRE family with cupin sensor [Roseibium suaedae]